MTSLTIDRLQEMQGSPVYSSEGEKIGSIEEIFVDEETQRPEWIGLGTGFFGTKRVLVPVATAELRGDGVHVPYTKDEVKSTPEIESDDISEQTEEELYSHYGLQYSERRSESGLPEGGGPARERGSTGEAEAIRHEEELRVGKRETEGGRARVRKWVETEPVETDVELRRETAHVTREPVDERATGADLGEQEIEVPLHEEAPVVEKEAVAKERIGVEKDVEVDRERVGGDVRKERVDVEEDVER